jgi:hypothetical protein
MDGAFSAGRPLALCRISFEKGQVMAPFARIIGCSLFAGGLVAVGIVTFSGQNPDTPILALVLGSVGGVIGAVAGAGREIATAVRERPTP